MGVGVTYIWLTFNQEAELNCIKSRKIREVGIMTMALPLAQIDIVV